MVDPFIFVMDDNKITNTAAATVSRALVAQTQMQPTEFDAHAYAGRGRFYDNNNNNICIYYY